AIADRHRPSRGALGPADPASPQPVVRVELHRRAVQGLRRCAGARRRRHRAVGHDRRPAHPRQRDRRRAPPRPRPGRHVRRLRAGRRPSIRRPGRSAGPRGGRRPARAHGTGRPRLRLAGSGREAASVPVLHRGGGRCRRRAAGVPAASGFASGVGGGRRGGGRSGCGRRRRRSHAGRRATPRTRCGVGAGSRAARLGGGGRCARLDDVTDGSARGSGPVAAGGGAARPRGSAQLRRPGGGRPSGRARPVTGSGGAAGEAGRAPPVRGDPAGHPHGDAAPPSARLRAATRHAMGADGPAPRALPHLASGLAGHRPLADHQGAPDGRPGTGCRGRVRGRVAGHDPPHLPGRGGGPPRRTRRHRRPVPGGRPPGPAGRGADGARCAAPPAPRRARRAPGHGRHGRCGGRGALLSRDGAASRPAARRAGGAGGGRVGGDHDRAPTAQPGAAHHGPDRADDVPAPGSPATGRHGRAGPPAAGPSRLGWQRRRAAGDGVPRGGAAPPRRPRARLGPPSRGHRRGKGRRRPVRGGQV
ncbi:MAG: hypothetical protein AVDCRST_MAG50-3309, partial [uncultured Acidimicrobiales bacterium]